MMSFSSSSSIDLVDMKTFIDYLYEAEIGYQGLFLAGSSHSFTISSYNLKALMQIKLDISNKLSISCSDIEHKDDKHSFKCEFSLKDSESAEKAKELETFLDEQPNVSAGQSDNPEGKQILKIQMERVMRYAERMNLNKALAWIESKIDF